MIVAPSNKSWTWWLCGATWGSNEPMSISYHQEEVQCQICALDVVLGCNSNVGMNLYVMLDC